MTTASLLFPLLLLAGSNPAGLGPVPAGTVRVYLVRHAEAFSNLTPTPAMPEKELDALTEKGKQQALAVGAALKAVELSVVLYSPTTRTRETGAAIVGGRGVALKEERSLRRIDNGKSQTGKPLALADRVAIWNVGRDTRPIEGESMVDLGDRVLRFLQSLRKDYAGQAVVCVTHAEPIGALLGHLKGTPGAARYPPQVPIASVTVIDLDAAGAAKEILARYEAAVP